LRNDYYDTFAKYAGPLHDKRRPNSLDSSEGPPGIPSTFGSPGLYECVSSTPITRTFDFTRTIAYVRDMEECELFVVSETKDLEGVVRGRTSEGWITLRDNYYMYFAQLVSDKYKLKPITLESDIFDPWGAKIDSSWPVCEWKITEVLTGEQCDRLGIDLGWRIIQIDDVKLREVNRDKVLMTLLDGRRCTILFAVPYKESDKKRGDSEITIPVHTSISIIPGSGIGSYLDIGSTMSHLTSIEGEGSMVTILQNASPVKESEIIPDRNYREIIINILCFITCWTKPEGPWVPRRCIKNSLPFIAILLWILQTATVGIFLTILTCIFPFYSIHSSISHGSGYSKHPSFLNGMLCFPPLFIILVLTIQAFLIPIVTICIFLFYISCVVCFLFISVNDACGECCMGYYDKRKPAELQSLWWEVYFWAKVEDFILGALDKALNIQHCT